jgi:hypothetical protein
VVKRLGFLKHLTFAALIFDAGLRLWMLVTASNILTCIDTLETEVGGWPGVNIGLHKYGGLQFNYHKTELGHVHSNGLLDIRFSRAIKAQLLADNRVTDHHVFTNSGWISFHIRNDDDMQYGISLLEIAYQKTKARHSQKRSHVAYSL